MRIRSILLTSAFGLCLIATITHSLHAQTDVSEPFKVGTFEIEGAPAVGIVLRDQYVVALNRANTALERDPAFPAIPEII